MQVYFVSNNFAHNHYYFIQIPSTAYHFFVFQALSIQVCKPVNQLSNFLVD